MNVNPVLYTNWPGQIVRVCDISDPSSIAINIYFNINIIMIK